MEFKGTPWPWIADDGDSHFFAVGSQQDGEMICYLAECAGSCRMDCLPRDEGVPPSWDQKESECYGRRYDRWEEHKANAHLIAAAPELLEELLKAREVIWALNTGLSGPLFQEQLNSIDAAIAKALGENNV